MEETRVAQTRLIDFSDLAGMQDRSLAFAVNKAKPWTTSDYAYLAANMFDQSIEELAKNLGRTAAGIWGVLTIDKEFISIREANGAVITERHRGQNTNNSTHTRDNRIITSDCDLLFNFGD